MTDWGLGDWGTGGLGDWERLAFLLVGSFDPTTETLRVGVASPLAIRRVSRRFSGCAPVGSPDHGGAPSSDPNHCWAGHPPIAEVPSACVWVSDARPGGFLSWRTQTGGNLLVGSNDESRRASFDPTIDAPLRMCLGQDRKLKVKTFLQILKPIPYSLFPIPYSLFPIPYSLFPSHEFY
jgi:hypothetical protein